MSFILSLCGFGYRNAARTGLTTKLTRRRKRRRRELATKAEAVGGRVQRLVVLLVGQFYSLLLVIEITWSVSR